MSIVVERKPYLRVTDTRTGWSLTGGRSYSDRSSTKEMTHAHGARCTLFLDPVQLLAPTIEVRVAGMLYLNPGESAGVTTLQKAPASGDFVTKHELYRIATILLEAWFRAGDPDGRSIHVSVPKN